MPSRIRKDNNGFDLKIIYDNNGGMYLVVCEGSNYVENTDEAFIKITIREIIKKVLEDAICLGLCIKPDLKIDDDNMHKQCIISKGHTVRILNS